MKFVRFGFAVAALLVVGTDGAGAQMVVNRNVSEQVDAPFYSHARQHLNHRHHYRHNAGRYHRRFIILQSPFATPQPFGWANCCV